MSLSRAVLAKALATAAVVFLLGALLGACGGGGGDASATTTATGGSAPERAQAIGSDGAPAETGPAAGPRDEAGSGGSGVRRDRGRAAASDPLATDPGGVAAAIVTRGGAVQTLPPNSADQARAMENSYASIKAYGAEATGSTATDITFALVQYLTARAEGDWATACARLYSPLRDKLLEVSAKSGGDPQLKGAACPGPYGALMGRMSASARAAAAQLDVASVRRDGERAFVIYKTPDALSADMPLYLEDGTWRVGALDAYVLSPVQAGAAG